MVHIFFNQPPSPCQLNNILQPSTFPNHHSPKSKDPPRYEEAVKQTRGLQASMQVTSSKIYTLNMQRAQTVPAFLMDISHFVINQM